MDKKKYIRADLVDHFFETLAKESEGEEREMWEQVLKTIKKVLPREEVPERLIYYPQCCLTCRHSWVSDVGLCCKIYTSFICSQFLFCCEHWKGAY